MSKQRRYSIGERQAAQERIVQIYAAATKAACEAVLKSKESES